MYNYEIIPSLQKEINKLAKKDKKRYEAVMSKIEEILKNPEHYKPLKHDLAGERRVHIMKSFVLFSFLDITTKRIEDNFIVSCVSSA